MVAFLAKVLVKGFKNRVQAYTDYIVSVISEEFGAIVVISLMVIF